MTMSDISNNAKITVIWRACIAVLGLLSTVGVAMVLSYVASANTKQDLIVDKLDETQSDVAQIKWELPVIKETAKNDKVEILKMIQNLEDRLQSIRNLRDGDSKEIGELRITIALLKQKLQLP